MASQIAAHVTVSYPAETPSLDDLADQVRLVAMEVAPFELRLGALVHHGDPARGIFVQVDDPDHGWRELRTAIVGAHADPSVPAHLTIVHPRTSGLGRSAWDELRNLDLHCSITVGSIAVTAFDGDGWATVRHYALGPLVNR